MATTLYCVTHTTKYRYAQPVSLSYSEARLVARSFDSALLSQRVLEHRLQVEPEWRDASERTDAFGNHVVYFAMPHPHSSLCITVTSRVELTPQPLQAHFAQAAAQSPPWEQVQEQLRSDLALVDLREFIFASPLVSIFAEAAAYAAHSFLPERPILAATLDLMHRIFTDFEYQPGVTSITTPLPEVYAARRGVCQDFAQFMLACLRSQGLACRYVSGYIENLPPPGQEKLQGSDASHAWVALFVPDLGWVDFDPTNDKIATDQHITLGWGRDFADVTPLKGIFFGGGESQLEVAVDVRRD